MNYTYQELLRRKEEAIKRRQLASKEISRGVQYINDNFGNIVADGIDSRFPDNIIAKIFSNSLRNNRKENEDACNYPPKTNKFVSLLQQGLTWSSPYLLSFGLGFIKRRIRRKFRRK